jgi:dihydrofolate reductase
MDRRPELNMRKVIYFAACSLDGFIEGPGGSLDWLMMTPEAGKLIEEFFPRVDTMLMGRRTWEFAAANGTGGAAGGGMQTVVFSRTLGRLAQPGVTLVRDDAAAFVREL